MQESGTGCESKCACQLRKAKFKGNKTSSTAGCSLTQQASPSTPTAACMQHGTAVATAPAVGPRQPCCNERKTCRSKNTQPDGTASSQPLQGCCCTHLTAMNKGGIAATWLPAEPRAKSPNCNESGQQKVAGRRPHHGLFPPSEECLG
jgi:hypothetical protein